MEDWTRSSVSTTIQVTIAAALCGKMGVDEIEKYCVKYNVCGAAGEYSKWMADCFLEMGRVIYSNNKI